MDREHIERVLDLDDAERDVYLALQDSLALSSEAALRTIEYARTLSKEVLTDGH